MITVTISINGVVLMARSAVNISPVKTKNALCKYEVDDGTVIEHNRKDGAVALARKLLDTIKETK